MIKNCEQCNKEFKSKRKTSLFCSYRCRGESQSTSIVRNCKRCEKEFIIQPHILLRKRGKFCSMACGAKNRFIDLTHEKFGLLTVISLYSADGGFTKWNTLCECGKQKIISSESLKGDKAKSCGCMGGGSRKPYGEASINQKYTTYKDDAKRRPCIFSISLDDFKSIVFQDCFYCGEGPQISLRKCRQNGKIPMNGIDRVDSSIGYVLSNLVPCCKMCNFMKLKYSQVNFLSHIEKIYSRQNKQKIINDGILSSLSWGAM